MFRVSVRTRTTALGKPRAVCFSVPSQVEVLTLPALFGDRGDDVCRHSELIEVGFLTDCSEVEIGNGYPVGLELGDEGVQERLKSICFGVQGAIPAGVNRERVLGPCLPTATLPAG